MHTERGGRRKMRERGRKGEQRIEDIRKKAEEREGRQRKGERDKIRTL